MDNTKSQSIAHFEQLIQTAKLIAQTNPRGLVDLVRAILRPLQSEYLLGVAERGQDALPTIGSFMFFGEAIRDRIFDSDGVNFRGVRLGSEAFSLRLSRDIVLPWAWDSSRYVDALATIGSDKEIVCENKWSRVSQGPWRQDNNHQVELWLPWGIGFVNAGNHSITAGILAGEGEITPEYVFDMSYLFEEINCDGRFFSDRTGRLTPVEDVRRAAVFEIGRMMHDLNFSAFKSIRDQARNRESHLS